MDRTPPQAWRLDVERSSAVQYHLQHIVIAHAGTKPLEAQRLPMWESRPSARSRDEAWKIAIAVHRELSSDPQRFAALARQHSDDLHTRALGGMLGHLRGGELHDRYHDVAYALAPGEVSGIFSTEAGLHILRRLALEEPSWVAARAVVLAYDGSLLSGASRTREETLQLASRLASTLRTDPGALAELARQHGALPDFPEGELGALSTHRSPWLGLVAAALRQARPGEVVGPFVTPLGVYVAVRPSLELPPVVAATTVAMPGQDAAQAARLRAILEADASTSADLVAQLESACPRCSVLRQRWFVGQAGAQLDELLSSVPEGSTRVGVFQTENTLLARREAPSDAHAWLGSDWLAEEPKLEFKDATSYIQRLSTEDLAYFVQAFTDDLRRLPGVPEDVRRTILACITDTERKLREASDPSQRMSAFAALHERLAKELPPGQYAQYQKFEQTWTRQAQLVPQ